jgi:RNA polymerase sigma factor (sigma-70 family)
MVATLTPPVPVVGVTDPSAESGRATRGEPNPVKKSARDREDDELAAAVRVGNDAMERLLLKYKDMVHRIIVNANPPSEVDPDELFQLGHIALARAVKKYRTSGGAKLFTYAYTAVRNEVQRAIGVQKSKWASLSRGVIEEDGADILSFVAEREPHPLVAAVREHLHELPTVAQRIVVMRFGIGGPPQNVTAIANTLGLSRAQVQHALSGALETLRELVSEDL